MFGGGGGGGMDPRKMKQMMEQMGVDMEELDANRVVIETDDADLVFEDVDVNKIDARGQETYQVVGSPEEREAGSASGAADADADAEESDGIPDDDIEIVSMRTGASEDAAREALEENDGDLAAAVDQLE
ncbi:Nascent polypeptide associated complex NAC [Natronoarchaeum philippinense]|uniref:Nascent polypeptide-associated complex protein n=1 Tax=Natronoarchaeum philippinense TaxID=558529 RepID=A0A285NUE4_NATPI|nr:nascent polypeptide-associated complex protein [Natronoarchaeum philippinense]SNZ12848.1 Nascent polypeptide associated complex NAC [Natronoarchaeum philippinense]